MSSMAPSTMSWEMSQSSSMHLWVRQRLRVVDCDMQHYACHAMQWTGVRVQWHTSDAFSHEVVPLKSALHRHIAFPGVVWKVDLDQTTCELKYECC